MTIPVWVIGGYLGAGKTTLLNALLRNARGVRYSVLVNDFGSVNVDAELIASSGTDTLELTNGCTCCTIGGDLILALKELLARKDPPERIVIEASGVADPQAVARLAACHPSLSVEGTIVVADAETILERAGNKYVGGLVRRQLASAGAVVLSKVDLIGTARQAEVRRWVEEAAGNARVFESRAGDAFPAEVAFDPHFAVREAAEPPQGSHPAFIALTFRTEKMLDRARFHDAARAMLPVVARAKGTLYFADAPRERCLFQLSGERWSVETLPSSQASRETRIVAVALASFGRRGSGNHRDPARR